MRTGFFAYRTIFYVKLLLVSLFFGLAVSLQAQNGNPQPKTDIKVRKQFDDRGQLMRYDSVYTWSYSSGNLPTHALTQKFWPGNFYRYTDSLWRSMFQSMRMLFFDTTKRQLMRGMEEGFKRLPQHQQPGFYHGGGKKAIPKATRAITI